jgi:hypothetical protein
MRITAELTDREADALFRILSLIDWHAQSESSSGISHTKLATLSRRGVVEYPPKLTTPNDRVH